MIPVRTVAHTSAVNRLFFASLLAIGALASACGKEIGDDCQTNVDCAEDNSRMCDLSQPGGYCTVDGCDEKSCPSESACVRFFPRKFPTGSCLNGQGCSVDDICLPEGICVPRTSERRYCARKCSDNGDCRDEYECREAGSNGAIALVADPTTSAPVRFCVASGQ